jgi:hypothetical protein
MNKECGIGFTAAVDCGKHAITPVLFEIFAKLQNSTFIVVMLITS